MTPNRGRQIRRNAEVLVAVLGFLALWEYGAGLTGMPAYILPVPSVVAARFFETLPLQARYLADTVVTTLLGLAMALVGGVLMALLVLYLRPIKAIILLALAALNSIPKIAIAPLFVIWFGLGDVPKVLLAFLLARFPIFVNSFTGLSEIEPDVLDLARLAGGTERRIFMKVRLMNALPYITDAVKVAFPLALVGSIVGEFIGGKTGIGYLILSAQFNMDTALVFAALMSITLFSTLGIGLVGLTERILFGWRPSRRTR
jgi:NitT/TauT family transport system permease protein